MEIEEPGEVETTCAFQETLEVLGQKHALSVVRVLGQTEPWRFNELQEVLDIPPKTLSARLKELASHGLVDRRQFNEIPPRVEYRLTEKGRGLCPIFEVLEAWHHEHTDGSGAAG